MRQIFAGKLLSWWKTTNQSQEEALSAVNHTCVGAVKETT